MFVIPRNLNCLKTVEDMPPVGTIIILLLVLIFLIAFVVPLARQSNTVTENFAYDPLQEVSRFNRNDLINRSKLMYNKFSDSLDVRRPTFIRSDDTFDIRRANTKMRDAMRTADLNPKANNAQNQFKTFMGIKPTQVTNQLPPASGIIQMAKQCEQLKTRDSCPNLDAPEYRNCGICIKGGTDHTDANPGKHIGGLLVLPDDRLEAEEAGRENGTAPAYFPTVGACPPGMLFLNSNVCTKESNRLNCKEVGETGGFVSGRTDEGKTATTASCAQVPTMGDDVYVYNPAERVTTVNLRVLTPIGTGKSIVWIYHGGKWKASTQDIVPGVDTVIPISGVKELDNIHVYILQEVPMRKSGKPEVFGFGGMWNRIETKEQAEGLCRRIGTSLATKQQLTDSWNKGAQQCDFAHTTDGTFRVSKQTLVEWRNTRWWWGGWWKPSYPCGFGNTVQPGPATSNMAWCYGIKPPVPDRRYWAPTINNFFDSFGSRTTPVQGPSKYSQYSGEADYAGPIPYRGVALQWEMENDSVKRTVPFEPTIQRVDNYAVKAGPGSILKRFGSVKGSSVFSATTNNYTQILRNAQWLWNKNPNAPMVVFSVLVPGVLNDPVYSEDAYTAARGPLLGKEQTVEMLKSSPCLREDQAAGAYSMSCLLSLFSGVSGDTRRGKLATENGGLTQLNNLGDSDAIAAYLFNLYSLARTGRDSEGNAVSGTASERAAIINDASQKLYGFDIATPCEEIVESEEGEVSLRPKNMPLTSECLNYLWLNTNSDKERYSETRTGSSVLNTYTTIGDRFSGLRNDESTKSAREKYPFQACQLGGSLAPMQGGIPNHANMDTVNRLGSIRAVQDMYNNVHKDANYSTDPKTQTLAMQQCYGVGRNPNASNRTACSVPARFVRVLPSSLMNLSDIPALQIPQLEVVDNKGTEVARNKPVFTSSVHSSGAVPEFAVDGRAYPHSHGEGEYHQDWTNNPQSDLDGAYWMVDLGATYNISEVRFSPRTDCCPTRQMGCVVQLLNDRKRVMAQKLLGSTNTQAQWAAAQKETITFSRKDLKANIPYDTLTPGMSISLQSAIHWNQILRHAGFQYLISSPDMAGDQYSPLLRNDGTLRLIPAKNGMSDHVSFQSVNYPTHLLGHSIGQTRIILAPEQAYSYPAEYKDIISWRPVAALNGNPTMVSFLSGYSNKSMGRTNMYIAVNKDNSRDVILDKTNDTLRDLERFCWTILPPLA